MPPILETKWWGWGRSDKSYHLASPSAFWGFLSQRLGPLGSSPSIDSLDRIPLPPARLTEDDLGLLKDVVGEENVSTDSHDRATHSLGKSYVDLIRLRRGEVPRPTDVVVYPVSENQIEAILNLARERDWIVIPFGGGTSVVGGVEPPVGSRPVLTLDLRQLNKVLAIDSESRLATVECGIFGPELEGTLNAAGYTLGHFPQSFEFSTLGGWIATRSAGQQSTKHGKIENIVYSLRVITPTGTIETPQVPAAATGPDLAQVLIGSEGTLGIITRAIVRLRPLPSHRKFSSFLFRSFEDGTLAVREMLQMELRPAVLRLSDEDETEFGALLGGLTTGWKYRLGKWWAERKGFTLPRSASLTLGFEAADESSARTLLGTEFEIATTVVKRNGGLPIGRGAGKRWHREQFELPYLRDLLLDRAVMVDTLETATSWQNLMTLHRSVRRSLENTIEAQNEKALVLTHLSHAYPEGASLYYTFLARQKPGDELAQWDRVKKAASETIVSGGGALSHQHGIGTMHRPWMRRYLGDVASTMMTSVKATVDPESVMNPASLIESEKRLSAVSPIGGQFSHRTRSANIERFAKEQFDLAVIGGGITGAGIARDAAMRGMKVALIDKGDIAGGTSSKSSGMIHGGLRYLRQLDIKMVRESLRERETLLHLAPHLVRPRPYLIPSYKGKLETLELRVGMTGYDFLAASKSLPHYQRLSKEEVAEREPLLNRNGLRGGFVYYDCLVNDARLTLATLKSAAEHGAAVANYVSCVGLEAKDGVIQGIHFHDVLGAARGVIHAKVVVNATGSWTDTIRALAGETGEMLRPTKGVHLVLGRESLRVHHVIVIFTPDDRIVFVVPFGRFTYIGTTDTDYSGPLDDVRAEAEDVSYLLNAVNETFEALNLTERNVVSTWAGLRPLLKEEGQPSSVSRDYKIAVNEKGLVSIAGGKLTTHRAMAEALLDEILARFADRFDRTFSECRTAELPLYGGDISDFEKYRDGELKGLGNRWRLSRDIVERLVHHYGTDYLKILALGLIDRELLRPLSAEGVVLKGEVIYAVEDEMSMSLEDFMERRTDLKHFDRDGGLNVAEEVATLMGRRLQWDEDERQRQLREYRMVVKKMRAFGSGPTS